MMTAGQTDTSASTSRIQSIVVLAPLLVVGETLAATIALGGAAFGVALVTRYGSPLTGTLGPVTRTSVALLVAAGCLALVDVFVRALFYEVHLTLGSGLALAMSAVMLGGASGQRSETPALTGSVAAILLLIALGAVRGMLGHGELLSRPLPVLAGGSALLATPAAALMLLGLVAAVLAASARRVPHADS